MERFPGSAIVTSRRRLLAATTPSVGLALPSCTEGENGAGSGNRNSTGDDSGQTPTPLPDNEEMTEGSPLVEVTVDPEFSGTVHLEGDCRDDGIELAPGEKAAFTRTRDGEECAVRLEIDTETRYETYIRGYESYSLTVEADGEIDEEVLVV